MQLPLASITARLVKFSLAISSRPCTWRRFSALTIANTWGAGEAGSASGELQGLESRGQVHARGRRTSGSASSRDSSALDCAPTARGADGAAWDATARRGATPSGGVRGRGGRESGAGCECGVGVAACAGLSSVTNSAAGQQLPRAALLPPVDVPPGKRHRGSLGRAGQARRRRRRRGGVPAPKPDERGGHRRPRSRPASRLLH